MRSIVLLLAAVTFTTGVASTADAQKLDKNGRCHAANGQMAKAEVCAGGSRTAPASAPAMTGPTKSLTTPAAAPFKGPAAPAKGARCKDGKSKFVKCGTP